jgi:glyoxylase-like metal-dependent hydrolase (beta-lactamase superfamily II)
MSIRIILIALAIVPGTASSDGTTEFCLDGEFDLGRRLQHHTYRSRSVPTSWCVTTDDDSDRVLFSMTGKSNPDMDGDWTVAYLPPNTVRIVNRESPPDVEFQNTNNAEEARSVRRIDPRRLFQEIYYGPISDVDLSIDGDLFQLDMKAILPVHGEVDVTWSWDWKDQDHPRLVLSASNMGLLFQASGRWRELSDEEAERIWQVTPGVDKIEVSGDRWPARINMQLINLTDDVYLVRGVRTGFQHLVVNTSEGLVVADAPASWIELHQIPPRRFLPELRIDGVSENLIAFLGTEFPGRPIRAVALTHLHDDHAGGAPAFAAVGAEVFATPDTAKFLSIVTPERRIPQTEVDRYRPPFPYSSVDEELTLGSDENRVKLVPMGSNPHVFEMLGVWAADRGYFFVSDVHVPRSDDDAPAAHRVETECWFAGWAVENLPPDVQVVNSHSPNITPVSRLAKYLESEGCRALGPTRTGT